MQPCSQPGPSMKCCTSELAAAVEQVGQRARGPPACRRRSPCPCAPTAARGARARPGRRGGSAPSRAPAASCARQATVAGTRRDGSRGQWFAERVAGLTLAVAVVMVSSSMLSGIVCHVMHLGPDARTVGVTSVAGFAMDSLITAAARALAAGDPLGALNRVALRDDPPALALRGIAMAQLGDLARAKALLRRAARAFGAEGGGGARPLRRRRGRDRAGLARPRLARQGARRGAGDARAGAATG